MQRKVQRRKKTLFRIACYLVYRLFAKHLPAGPGAVGRLSSGFRRAVCRPLLREAAGVFHIAPGADFGNGSCLVMKEHAELGRDCSITGNGIVTIGKHAGMGRKCMIVTQNHRYLEEGYDGYDVKDVLIDDHALLGHRVIVLPGVTIGKHAFIGAGAVVTKNIPEHAVAAGIPAKVIKYRK